LRFWRISLTQTETLRNSVRRTLTRIPCDSLFEKMKNLRQSAKTAV
jgi:hypothetical protein